MYSKPRERKENKTVIFQSDMLYLLLSCLLNTYRKLVPVERFVDQLIPPTGSRGRRQTHVLTKTHLFDFMFNVSRFRHETFLLHREPINCAFWTALLFVTHSKWFLHFMRGNRINVSLQIISKKRSKSHAHPYCNQSKYTIMNSINPFLLQ